MLVQRYEIGLNKSHTTYKTKKPAPKLGAGFAFLLIKHSRLMLFQFQA
jgi:hypothetical protein